MAPDQLRAGKINSFLEEKYGKGVCLMLSQTGYSMSELLCDFLICVDEFALGGSGYPSKRVYLIPKEIAEEATDPDYMQRFMQNPYAFLHQEILDNPAIMLKKMKGMKNMPISIAAMKPQLARELTEEELASMLYGTHPEGMERDDPLGETSHSGQHRIEQELNAAEANAFNLERTSYRLPFRVIS